MKSRETIVFIHGIGSHPIALGRLIVEANQRGYSVIAWNYPSRQKTGPELASDLAAFLKKKLSCHDEEVHFVTHSLGGYITSLFLAQNKEISVGRVVMIAPPLAGSEIIDEGASWLLFRKIFGPVISELGTRPANSEHPELHPEIAVIAGNRTRWPWSLLFRDENDGKVAVSSTKNISCKEHIVVPYSHTEITFRTEVTNLIFRFIKTGSMKKTHASSDF